MSFFDSETDIESDDECLQVKTKSSKKTAKGGKFDEPLVLLQRSLYEIVKSSKDQVFKCHCLARLDTDETGLEARLNGLISALSIGSADEACGEQDMEKKTDFESLVLGCDVEEQRVESDVDFLLTGDCEVASGVDAGIKDEFDYLSETIVDFAEDSWHPDFKQDLETFKVFEDRNDDFDALL